MQDKRGLSYFLGRKTVVILNVQSGKIMEGAEYIVADTLMVSEERKEYTNVFTYEITDYRSIILGKRLFGHVLGRAKSFEN